MAFDNYTPEELLDYILFEGDKCLRMARELQHRIKEEGKSNEN